MQAWDAYRSASPSTQQLFARTLSKLRLRELRLRSSDQVHNCDCRVFPKGHRTERLFYFETEDGRVHVCELARHSDQSYERLMQAGVRREHYQNFQPWHEDRGQ